MIFRIGARRPGKVTVLLNLTSFGKICLSLLKPILLSNTFTKLSDEFDPINFKSL